MSSLGQSVPNWGNPSRSRGGSTPASLLERPGWSGPAGAAREPGSEVKIRRGQSMPAASSCDIVPWDWEHWQFLFRSLSDRS